jgi:hypothetical protein
VSHRRIGGKTVRRLLCIGIAFLLTAGAGHAACSDDEATQVRMAREALYALPSGEDLDGRVSEAGRNAIEAFKDRVDAFARAVLRCQPDEPTAQGVEAALDRVTDLPGEHTYGNGPTFAVRIPKSPSGLVAVTSTFGIKCGFDAMLMIFERRGQAWSEALAARAKPYRAVDGGWWTLDYAISQLDADGHWFVALKHVAPWCSSTWSDIGYALLRPSGNPARPTVLLDAHQFMWWGNDDYGQLEAGRDDFKLTFTSNALDTNVRRIVRRYSVAGDVVQRIPPYADTPRGFVDEWLAGDWKDVGTWSLPANRARLRSVHDRVTGARDKNHVFYYASAYACPDGRFQIELYDDDLGTSDFFLTQGKEELLDATHRPDPRCVLPDPADPAQ